MPHPSAQNRRAYFYTVFSYKLLNGLIDPKDVPAFEEWEARYLALRQKHNQKRREKIRSDPELHRTFNDRQNARRHNDEYRKKKREYDKNRQRPQSEIEARRVSRKRWEERKKLEDPEGWKERQRLKRQRYISKPGKREAHNAHERERRSKTKLSKKIE